MGFDVNPAALAGLPVLLDRRARELDAASRYLLRHACLAPAHASAALHPLHAAQERVVDAVRDVLVHCAGTLSSQAAAVRAALARYADADAASAAALDRALPLPARHGTLPHSVYPGAGPRAFPCDWVVAAELRFPPHFRVQQPVEVTSGNPFAALQTPHRVLRWLFAQHPMFDGLAAAEARGWIVPADLPAGDWPGCHAAAYCCERLGAALTAVGASLAGAARILGTVWTGHAAVACTSSLVSDADALHRIALAVTRLAPPYQRAANAARSVEVAVSSLLLSLADVAYQPVDLILGAPVVVHELTGAIHCYDTARQATEHAVTAADATVAQLHAEQ